MLPPDETASAQAPGRAAILLAAGASTRLGHSKQLVLMEGKSLLRRAAEAAVASGASPVIVVLGKEAELLLPELAGLAVFPVVNHAWQQGMGSSLCCGVEVLQSQYPSTTSLLCMVCDQPHVTAVHLDQLWSRHAATGKVIAVRYGDHPGVPAVFPAKYLSELAEIKGDKGARSLLASFAEAEIELLDLPEAGFDLDTPQDLQRLAGYSRK